MEVQLIGISVAPRGKFRPGWSVAFSSYFLLFFIYLFIGVLWIGGAVVLSASIRRSFFEGGPLAFALKLLRLPNCIGEESADN